MMSPPTPNETAISSTWTVQLIPQDEKGFAFYFDSYRPFRLMMLQVDPDSFSSTLTREKAFDAAVWRRRALDPLARTFVAVLNHDNMNNNINDEDEDQPQEARRRGQVIISSLILRGPFPNPHPSPSPSPNPGRQTSNEGASSQPSSQQQQQSRLSSLEPPHNPHNDKIPMKKRIEWEINGVYTDHRFRRRGVASAVFEAATKFALGESAAFGGGGSGGVDCVLRLGVTRGNGAARKFYEKAGFVSVLKGDGGDGDGDSEDGEVDLVRVFAL